MSLNSLRKTFHKSGKWILGGVTVAMLVTAFTGIGANIMGNREAASGGVAKDPTIITVNGAAVPRSQFDQALAKQRQQNEMMQRAESVLDAAQEHANIINELIDNQLFLQIAQQRGITVTSSDIDAARQQQLVGLRKELGLSANASEQEIDSTLQKYNGATVDQLYPDDQLRPQIILQKYNAELTSGTKVSDQDVLNSFRQSHVRHILISNKKRSDVQAQALANHLIDKLKAGADFATLAAQYSDDPTVKTNKGDDGWIDQTTSYVPEFKKAALSLSKGQITPAPVKSDQYGYFIIQCLGTKENLPKDFQKNKQQYAASVTEQQVNDQEQAALTAAMSKAKIVVIDPELRADRELYLAQSSDASDPTKRNADLTAALADYQKALAGARYSVQGEIHASMASVYLMQNQTDKEIEQLAAAAQNSGDPQMNLILGNLYVKKGDTKDALDQFALASEAAYDNVGVHFELASIYKQIKQPALAAKENAWVKDYTKRQQQAAATNISPGVSVTPGAGGKGLVLQPPPSKKAH